MGAERGRCASRPSTATGKVLFILFFFLLSGLNCSLFMTSAQKENHWETRYVGLLARADDCGFTDRLLRVGDMGAHLG